MAQLWRYEDAKLPHVERFQMTSKLGAGWQRLRGMSGTEIGERLRQEAAKRIDLALYQARAMPRAESGNGAAIATAKFFFEAEQLPGITAILGERLPQEVNAIIERAKRILEHRFDLLGYEDLDYGRNIDWHLDAVHGKRAPQKPWYKVRYLDFAAAGDVKVTWELNRHQHLVTLAKAYVATNDKRFAREVFAQWYSWREQNPYPIGVNWASSLEVSFRAIAWLWTKWLLAGCAVKPTEFEGDLREALWLSGRHIERYLSTYFSPNTHLLGEGVGLFFIGALCPELSAAARWRELGWKTIVEEADHQVRADGIHFEQATYYHVYALDFFLHAAILARRNGMEVPATLERTIERMLEALLLMSQAGIAPRFGDDDGGRLFDSRRNRFEHMLDPLATGAALFGRADFKASAGDLREETVWLLGEEGIRRFDELPEHERRLRSTAFHESGLYVMAADSNDGPAQLVIDAGPQGALGGGHGHADALSLQVSKAGNPLLIDPGTYEYVGEGEGRGWFRGTAAHNTLQIDRHDQSGPKGPFSWQRLIAPTMSEWMTSENLDLFAGKYETEGLIHRRDVVYVKPDFWLVRDVVEGTGRHRVSVRWHLAPELSQSSEQQLFFRFSDGRAGLGIVSAGGQEWAVSRQEKVWSPAYGRKEAASVLQFERETEFPAEIATVLAPVANADRMGELTRIARANGAVAGYAYTVHDEVHRIFFADSGQSWTMENWSSDAGFLYSREDSAGLRCVVFCNGSRVEFAGSAVVSADTMVRRCDLMVNERRIICGQAEAITVHGWPESGTRASGMETVAARIED